jgi:hypothetical protein
MSLTHQLFLQTLRELAGFAFGVPSSNRLFEALGNCDVRSRSSNLGVGAIPEMISSDDKKISPFVFRLAVAFSLAVCCSSRLELVRAADSNLTGASAMLQKLSDEVRDCYQHAKDCARKAAAQADPAVRQSFLDAQQSWLKLVRRLAAVPERKST